MIEYGNVITVTLSFVPSSLMLRNLYYLTSGLTACVITEMQGTVAHIGEAWNM